MPRFACQAAELADLAARADVWNAHDEANRPFGERLHQLPDDRNGWIAFLGDGIFAVAFEDERLGTTSHEDIRARLLRAVGFSADTIQVVLDGASFMVNDDTMPQPPDESSELRGASRRSSWRPRQP